MCFDWGLQEFHLSYLFVRPYLALVKRNSFVCPFFEQTLIDRFQGLLYNHRHTCRWTECIEWVLSGYAYIHICMYMHYMWIQMHTYACRVSLGGVVDMHMHTYVCICIHKSAYVWWYGWVMPHDPREECGGTYIGVSECTRREEYDGIGGGSKWGFDNTVLTKRTKPVQKSAKL